MSAKTAARKAGKENAPPRVGSRVMSQEPVIAEGPDPLDGDMDIDELPGIKSRAAPLNKTVKGGKPSKVAPSKAPKSKSGAVLADAHARAGQSEEPEEVEREERRPGGRAMRMGSLPRDEPYRMIYEQGMMTEDEDEQEESRGRAGASTSAVKIAELEKQLALAKTAAQRAAEERDAANKRFEQMAAAGGEGNGDGSDKSFDRYKEKVDVRARAQGDVIATQKTLIEQLQARVEVAEKQARAGGTAPVSAPAAPPAQAGSADADVEKIKAVAAREAKAAKEQIAALRKELAGKDEQLSTLQKDYEAEVRLSKEAAQKRSTSTIATAPILSTEEQAKDTALIKLYEDLTNLTIPNVRFKEGGAGQEITYVCVQTMDRRSLNFKLKAFQAWQDDASHPKGGKYVKQLSYEPLALDKEQDRSFVKSLGVFGEPLLFPRENSLAFFCRLRDVMEAEAE